MQGIKSSEAQASRTRSGLSSLRSIIIFSGSSEGHYIHFRDGAWFLDTKTMKGAKAMPNIVSAISELERASKVPSGMFEIGFPEMALVPILRRVG